MHINTKKINKKKLLPDYQALAVDTLSHPMGRFRHKCIPTGICSTQSFGEAEELALCEGPEESVHNHYDCENL